MRNSSPESWSSRLTFVSHGAQIEIRADEETFLEAVREILPESSEIRPVSTPDVVYSIGLSKDHQGVERHYDLFEAKNRISSKQKLTHLLRFLLSELHFKIAQHAREVLFVHAGVVGWKNRTIVIPGRSMSGKTSLVAALVRAGAVYYSDEYAVVDRSGWVHPYPKPLSIRNKDGSTTQVDAASLGKGPGRHALPASMIVVSRYREGATWRPRRLTRGQAVLALIDNSVLASSQKSDRNPS